MTTIKHGSLSTNSIVNGLLWDGWKYQPATGSSIVTLHYKFDQGEVAGKQTKAWSTAEKAAYLAAAQAWEGVAGIDMIETTSSNIADVDMVEVMAAKDQMPSGGSEAYASHSTPRHAYYNAAAQLEFGYFNYQADGYSSNSLKKGGIYGMVFLHELGHGLGLKHTFEKVGSAPLLPGVVDGGLGDNNLNHMFSTIMSYNWSYGFDDDGKIKLEAGNPNTDSSGNKIYDYGYAIGPMALDIAAIQHLYGANMNTNKTSTVYVLPDANIVGTGWRCIWDAGGTDELRYNGTRNAILDLRAATLDNSAIGGGALSYAANIYGGYTIANGVVIERASGGSGDDTITGNDANNLLSGNLGADTISGGHGSDTINGGDGHDILRGNAGRDRIDGGTGYDSVSYADQTKGIIVTLNGANWVTVAVGSDTDPSDVAMDDDTIANVEDVIGSSGKDTIKGDGAGNIIQGMGGADTLDGIDGTDTVDYSEKTQSVVLTLSTSTTYATVTVGDVVEDQIRRFENVLGGYGGDRLTGNSGKNQLRGNGGYDTLSGGAGDDELDGGADADTADYTYLTNAGSEIFVALDDDGGGTVSVAHETGSSSSIVETDTLISIERITGGAGGDYIFGNKWTNILKGNGGNDYLSGGGGKDTLDGGDGTNAAAYLDKTAAIRVTLNTAGSSIVYVNGLAEDTLTNIQNVFGGSGDDVIVGNALANTFDGGEGDDTLTGGAGFDKLYGGLGSDTADYASDTRGVKINLGAPDAFGFVIATTLSGTPHDQLFSIENLIGGSGDDRLTGDFLNNRLYGGAGFDTLIGGDGGDILRPGAGGGSVDGGNGADDTIDFSDLSQSVEIDLVEGGTSSASFFVGGDPVNGTRGTSWGTARNVEFVIGGTAGDKLIGDDAQSGNRLYGGLGNDALYGMGGSDTLIGGAGKDFLDGGTEVYGGDVADYSDKTSAISVTLTGATSSPSLFAKVFVGGVEEDTLVRIENIIGGTAGDTIKDGETASQFGISNRFWGGGGADTIDGGRGDDTIIGGLGKDTLNGGEGIDTLSYEDRASNEAVTIVLRGATVTTVRVNGVNEDTISTFENAWGGEGNDRLTGDTGMNTLNGGGGDDTLNGGGGTGFDYLDGGYSGFDTADFSGQTRNLSLDFNADWYAMISGDGLGLAYLMRMDKVVAGSGNDRLNGGAGEHTFTGNGGADSYTFDTAFAATNRVSITDFRSGSDVIEIDNSVFTAWTEGAVGTRLLTGNFTEGTSNATTKAGAQIIFNTKTGALLYDGDGGGGSAAVQFATLSETSDRDLNANDFLIV